MKLGTYAPLVSIGLCLWIGACHEGTMVATTHTTSGEFPALTPGDPGKSDLPESPTGAAAGMPSMFDQGTGAEDVAVTRQIRQGLLSDDALSAEAKNVKITTGGGVVIARGPVKSAAEKAEIWSKVLGLAGNNRVDDQTNVEDK